jgi:hypothetical protein
MDITGYPTSTPNITEVETTKKRNKGYWARRRAREKVAQGHNSHNIDEGKDSKEATVPTEGEPVQKKPNDPHSKKIEAAKTKASKIEAAELEARRIKIEKLEAHRLEAAKIKAQEAKTKKVADIKAKGGYQVYTEEELRPYLRFGHLYGERVFQKPVVSPYPVALHSHSM